MRLILKYKNQIVSIGLIPIIITLIGLHFFPNTQMLGIGFTLSVVMMIYNIWKMKDLNFFLLLGTLGIGLCFFLRLFWGYKYVPVNTITPTLELSLLVFTFLYNTAPEIYNGIVKRLGFKNCKSYQLETTIILAMSSIHLIVIYFIGYFDSNWIYKNSFIIFNVIPVSIYITCFIINVTGIRIAAKINAQNSIDRIALVCNGKIFLTKNKRSILDLPYQKISQATKNVDLDSLSLIGSIKELVKTKEKPRLIMRYSKEYGCGCKMDFNLYVLPLKNESDVKNNSGSFCPIEEIEKHPELYSNNLVKEYISLKNAADRWKDFYSTCK